MMMLLFRILMTKLQIVKCGVPQGYILRPLLFLIFVNDLNNSTIVLNPLLFVDDVNLFCLDDNICTLFETANKNWTQLILVFADKQFLNVEKTKYVLFHKLTDQNNFSLKRSSLLYNTCARYERHESDISETRGQEKSDTSATRVHHKCDTNDTIAIRVKNYDLDNESSENIFSQPFIRLT